jgi:CDP-2,3-bis-(O-geranylgeranyl)-sn-glycerol synthase
MEGTWLSLKLLVLLVVANGAPVIAARVLGNRWAAPLDGGLRFADGRPLLGPSKTIRGVILAIAASGVVGPALGVPARTALLIGAAAMAGDALSSFVKRRLGVAPSGRALGLDQIPEALLPLLAVQAGLALSAGQIAAITAAFFAIDVLLARLAYALGLRDRPH